MYKPENHMFFWFSVVKVGTDIAPSLNLVFSLLTTAVVFLPITELKSKFLVYSKIILDLHVSVFQVYTWVIHHFYRASTLFRMLVDGDGGISTEAHHSALC